MLSWPGLIRLSRPAQAQSWRMRPRTPDPTSCHAALRIVSRSMLGFLPRPVPRTLVWMMASGEGQCRMIAVVVMARRSYAARNSRICLLMPVGRCTIKKCPTPSISSDCDPGPQWSGTRFTCSWVMPWQPSLVPCKYSVGLVMSLPQAAACSQAGAFRAADLVFDPGLGTVAGPGELDLPAGGAGGGDLVALALVLLEQRQLRAGVRVLPADDDPHVRRPPGEAVTAGAVPQQPGQLSDLRVRPRRPVCVQRRSPWAIAMGTRMEQSGELLPRAERRD